MSATSPSAVQAGRFTVQPIDQIIFGTPLADAIIAEAREQAAAMLELRLVDERASLARAESSAKERAEIAAQMMLAEQEVRIRAEMQATITAISDEKNRMAFGLKGTSVFEFKNDY